MAAQRRIRVAPKPGDVSGILAPPFTLGEAGDFGMCAESLTLTTLLVAEIKMSKEKTK